MVLLLFGAMAWWLLFLGVLLMLAWWLRGGAEPEPQPEPDPYQAQIDQFRREVHDWTREN